MPHRVFLPATERLLPQLCDRLLPDRIEGPFDLGGTLILVPTRQSGRRLREHLTRQVHERGGTALLSSRVRPPASLFQPDAQEKSAHAFDLLQAWTRVLTAASPAELEAFLPGRTSHLSPAQALETGQRLQNLREELADADRDLASVIPHLPLASEQQRWTVLAELETAYRTQLASMGLEDPCDAKRRRARRIQPPEGVERLVLAAVPDPSPLALLALQQLESRLPIEVWIHANADEADLFDVWGRPTEAWHQRPAGPAAPADQWLELHADPEALCRRITELVADAPASPDLALGLLDGGLSARLAMSLARTGRELYDPTPTPLSKLDPARLLLLLDETRDRRDFDGLRTLWRHPDLLAALSEDPDALLQAWDLYAKRHVPTSIEAVDDTLQGPTFLLQAWQKLRRWMHAERAADRLQALSEIYANRETRPSLAADRLLGRAAETTGDLLQEAARRETAGQGPPPALVLRLLKDEQVDPLRVEADVTAEGWLELPYHPAENLLLAGLQEGTVPGTRVADPFLPDSLRAALGLRSDRDWLARDAYLLDTLCRSRPEGAVRVLCMKRDSEGGPLLPSRLLFHCGDAELLQRARLLFGDVPPPPQAPHAAPGLKLDLRRPPASPLQRLSITAFRAYLACPTRFYLSAVLGMSPLDDRDREPDAMAFGTLLHQVLEEGIPDDPLPLPALTAELDRLLDAQILARYGPRPGLAVEVFAWSARVRLHAAARLQLTLWEEGWRIWQRELKLERDLNGLTIVGKIDRIDRHPHLGIRILDYKTSDSPSSPQQVHLGPCKSENPAFHVQLGKKTQQWTDLQLPAYRWLAENESWYDPGLPLRVAYFQLPKAVSDTAVAEWDQEAALAPGARAAMAEVVRLIQAGVWGPPAPSSRFDDFASLFHHGEAGIILPESSVQESDEFKIQNSI